MPRGEDLFCFIGRCDSKLSRLLPTKSVVQEELKLLVLRKAIQKV